MRNHKGPYRLVIAAAVLLAGCGPTLLRNPLPEPFLEEARPLGLEGLRFWGDVVSAEQLQNLVATRMAFLQETYEAEAAAEDEPVLSFLGISGGGQWGAFGAGVLRAWSESGTRPEFAGVSGISTGALIAPFAFLGPKYDPVLEEVYTAYQTDDLVEPKIFSGIVSGAALADTSKLEAIIAEKITPEFLDEIAAEHRKGRILLVGTTNLDAGRPVIWNMGAIAASGHPDAARLFRQVILASASIPVAFPPAIIKVVAPDGNVYDEMHVDGGATSQVTFVSPSIPVRALTEEALGRNIQRRLYLIMNNDLAPPYAPITPRIAAIGGAAVSSLIRGSGTGDLYKLYLIAQRDDIEFEVGCDSRRNPVSRPAGDLRPGLHEVPLRIRGGLVPLGRALARRATLLHPRSASSAWSPWKLTAGATRPGSPECQVTRWGETATIDFAGRPTPEDRRSIRVSDCHRLRDGSRPTASNRGCAGYETCLPSDRYGGIMGAIGQICPPQPSKGKRVMTSDFRTGQRRVRSGIVRSGLTLIAAAALAGSLVPGNGFSQEYKTGAQVYGLPKAETVKAKKADIDQVDSAAQALVDQLRAGSPTAVDYADRAHGALIFPNVETATRLLLGETNALGVLYVKDSDGKYQKHGYYQGRRSSLGFQTGSSSSSRIFMFMTEEALKEFLDGEISATYMLVNPETGEISGDADADIAAFVTNVKGDVRDVSFKGLFLAPIEIIN